MVENKTPKPQHPSVRVVLFPEHLAWLNERRRSIPMSVYIRSLIDQAMAEEKQTK